MLVGVKHPSLKIYTYAMAGNRTRNNCLEGSYADHYTTDAHGQDMEQMSHSIWKVARNAHQSTLPACVDIRLVPPEYRCNKCWGYSSVVEQSAAVR